MTDDRIYSLQNEIAAKNDETMRLKQEVKELREEKEQRLEQAQALVAASDSELEKMVLRLQDDRLRLASRIKQMEEALREILSTELDLSFEWRLGPATAADVGIPWDEIDTKLYQAMKAARAALSPSDTEEEA